MAQALLPHAGFVAYQAIGRTVIIPTLVDEKGCHLDDAESLLVCSTSKMSDLDLGELALRASTMQRQLPYAMDFRSEYYRRWAAVQRRQVCKAFGVEAAKDWLAADATFVTVSATDSQLNIQPMRRYGKRDTWAGHKSDPTETVPIAEPAAVGAALRRMLALHLPPAR